jgi:hypothetical protein
VVFEEDGGGGGIGPGTSKTTGSATASTSVAAAGTGSSSVASSSVTSGSDVASSASSGGFGCEGQVCGAFCEVCAPDCNLGFCDADGICRVQYEGDPDECPTPAQVVSGVACGLEGAFCPSDRSCSGFLLCMCGRWTLINPC